MKVIFCNSLLKPDKPDEDFIQEYNSANNAGLESNLISLESLKEEDTKRALRQISYVTEKQIAIYRGWMLQPEEYERLYNSLLEKNVELINSPTQYLNCHYFPNSYSSIKEYTPKSIWFECSGKVDFNQVYERLKIFEGKPVIVKDFVKSEKYYWEKACFIPSASNEEAVRKVTSKFLELRGSFLNKGLVYRQFVDLEKLANNSESRMPLAKEFRLFYFNGKLLEYSPYWSEGEYDKELPDFSILNQAASHIENNFFTVDVAKQINGKWIIMELGDGQVSGLPESLNSDSFYKKLNEVSKTSYR